MPTLYRVVCSVLLFFASGLIVPAIAFTYQHDDGMSESSVGCGGCNVIWLNAFQANASGTLISDIDIAFGHPDNGDPPPNGTSISILLWSDPTNDGDPTDAVLVTTVSGTIQSSHTNTFINFALPSPVPFAVNDWFFVGFQSTDYAVASDTSSTSAGQSWIAAWGSGSTADPSDLSSANVAFGVIDSVGFPGNFLIRANASTSTATSIPTLSEWGLILLILSLSFMGWFTKRTQ